MADDVLHVKKAVPAGPTTVEAFTADREVFWGTFTRVVLYSVIGLVVLLLLMLIFLV